MHLWNLHFLIEAAHTQHAVEGVKLVEQLLVGHLG